MTTSSRSSSAASTIPELPARVGVPRYRIALLAALTLVLFRSAVWVIWEQSYFDSDQAITGLMAKHLAEGRAVPLVFYGQHYALAVEAWLTAPFIAAFGASVQVLKLPLLAMNLCVAWLLVRCLCRDAGLRPAHACVASLFFLVPAPVASSRLLEASGVAIEPFLYTLVLWMVRDRAVLFGLIAGIGILNRELTVYAVVAVWLLELRYRPVFTRLNLLSKAVVVLGIAACATLFNALKPHADLLGPGTAGTLGGDLLTGQADWLASRFCFSASALVPNIRWLVQDNLAALFGWRVGSFTPFFDSHLSSRTWWTWLPMAGLGATAAAALGPRAVVAAAGRIRSPRASSRESVAASRDDRVPSRAFPAYLVLIGLQAVAAYALVSCDVRDPMLVRYTLLALLLPVGVSAALLRHHRTLVVALASVSAMALASAAASDHARILREYVWHRPPNDYRALADHLEREGIRYGMAPYWTAYRIDFLTNERVTLDAYEKVRIREYADAVARHEDQSVSIFFDDPCSEPGTVRVARWCLMYEPRARHAQ